jgi:hypothetical protein
VKHCPPFWHTALNEAEQATRTGGGVGVDDVWHLEPNQPCGHIHAPMPGAMTLQRPPFDINEN